MGENNNILKSINPFNLETINTFKVDDSETVASKILNSHRRFQEWKSVPIDTKVGLLENLSQQLTTSKRDIALIMTNEMGKTLKEAESEIEKCVWLCDYYRDNAEKFLQKKSIEKEGYLNEAQFHPLGVILGVMPWNFPFWQVFRFAVPTLMAGNTVIIKHSSNVTGCLKEIERLFLASGFPDSTATALYIQSSEVAQVIKNRLVQGVSLTGSTKAGRAVAQRAGECLKKTVLELGGSDPYIILEDADLDVAAKACADSRLLNSGQSCIGAKRFILTPKIRDEFIDKVQQIFRDKIMGDPTLPETDLGPLARMDLRSDLHDQVTSSINKGAFCLIGGFYPDALGSFYPPTLLTDVKPGMAAFDEEMFGPTAAIIDAKDEREALSLANQSSFGLGGAIFTKDLEKGYEFASHYLNSGMVFVNDYVKSDPRLPFGGIKQSGYGRELGEFGIREFVNVKTVSINQL